jgi:hypothetical protein
VTVTNSTNINKTNKKLSIQIIEHKKTSTYANINAGSVLELAQKCDRVTEVNPIPAALDSWISDGNTEIKQFIKCASIQFH